MTLAKAEAVTLYELPVGWVPILIDVSAGFPTGVVCFELLSAEGCAAGGGVTLSLALEAVDPVSACVPCEPEEQPASTKRETAKTTTRVAKLV